MPPVANRPQFGVAILSPHFAGRFGRRAGAPSNQATFMRSLARFRQQDSPRALHPAGNRARFARMTRGRPTAAMSLLFLHQKCRHACGHAALVGDGSAPAPALPQMRATPYHLLAVRIPSENRRRSR